MRRTALPAIDHHALGERHDRGRRLVTFDPAHYEGRRLVVALPAKELVSTFGHGSHACPAQRFAISAIRIAVRRLLERYDVTPEFSIAEPRPGQLGAVARAAAPCVVRYRARG